MVKNKIILTMGVTLLFLGLAFSPITATEATELITTIEYTVVGEDGTYETKTMEMTEQELNNIEQIIIDLTEKLGSIENEDSLNDLLDNLDIGGESPILTLIINIIKKRFQMKQNRNEFLKDAMAPRRALVVSHGDSLKTLFSGENKVKFVKPFITWAYFNHKLGCKTTIIDPVPFKTDTLTGRQIGLIRGFVGLYIFHRSARETQSNTYFIGIGGLVRGFDLSPSIFPK